MNNQNEGVKIILILIIISLIILGILGSIYYFSQSEVRLKYVKANEHFNLGSIADIRNGIKEFRYLAEKYPKSKYASKALYQIGYGYELIYWRSKDENKLNFAANEYFKVYKNYRQSKEAENALFQIAHINYLKKDYEEAQEKLDYILTEYMGTDLKSKIYTKKGYIYLETGEYQKALKYFNQQETYRNDLSIIGKAKCYFALGEYIKGINAYEELLRYRQTSNYRAETMKSFLENAYSYAKKLAEMQDYNRSNMLYDKIINLVPDHLQSEYAMYWKAENQYAQKKYNEAINQFSVVLKNKHDQKDDAANFKLGMCYFETGRFEESLKYFQQIIDYHQNSSYLKMAMDWKRQTIREIKYRH
jgi:tetratricopeptide (TPR) repeat protein